MIRDPSLEGFKRSRLRKESGMRQVDRLNQELAFLTSTVAVINAWTDLDNAVAQANVNATR